MQGPPFYAPPDLGALSVLAPTYHAPPDWCLLSVWTPPHYVVTGGLSTRSGHLVPLAVQVLSQVGVQVTPCCRGICGR